MAIFKRASRSAKKLKVLISAPTGRGKTYSALCLARGISSSWGSILVIDTENDSASLYTHLCGNEDTFFTQSISAPFSPEKFISIIQDAEKQGIETIIIDSSTHEWEGAGGCLSIQQDLGGRFQDWKTVTPRHQAFLNTIIQCKCHVICTARKEEGYVIEGNRPVKVGLKDKQREGFAYEFDLCFTIDNDKHLASVTKNRTGLFVDSPEFKITEKHGKELLDWSNAGGNKLSQAVDMVNRSTTLAELSTIWNEYKDLQSDELFKNAISAKKQLLVEEKELQSA
jgi:hypothetical protein